MVKVRINGEERDFDSEPTVEEALRALQVPSMPVAVEVNRTVIPRRAHPTHILRHGDEVEVVTFVGGG